MSGWLRRWWPAIAAHVALIALWHLAVTWGDVPSFVLPTPLATLQALFEPHYNWLQHTLASAAYVLGSVPIFRLTPRSDFDGAGAEVTVFADHPVLRARTRAGLLTTR